MRFLPGLVHSSRPSDAGFGCCWKEYSRKNCFIASSQVGGIHKRTIITADRSAKLTIIATSMFDILERLKFRRAGKAFELLDAGRTS